MSEWEEVLPGLQRLSLLPYDLLNVYLLGDVLVDSGSRFNAGRLLAALEGQALQVHALTHAHMDHQGASRQICQRLGIPLWWCGEGDRGAMESGDYSSLAANPRALVSRMNQLLVGPAHPVARTLLEGDEVGGFRVVAAPGHTSGHLAFWREADRALVAGDVFFHRNPLTLQTGLMEPFRAATYDLVQNRASARKLAALRPEVVCFGHGPPLHDGAAPQSGAARRFGGLRRQRPSRLQQLRRFRTASRLRLPAKTAGSHCSTRGETMKTTRFSSLSGGRALFPPAVEVLCVGG